MSDLLVRLPSMGAYSADDLRAGFGKVTEQLDDLMCDDFAFLSLAVWQSPLSPLP